MGLSSSVRGQNGRALGQCLSGGSWIGGSNHEVTARGEQLLHRALLQGESAQEASQCKRRRGSSGAVRVLRAFTKTPELAVVRPEVVSPLADAVGLVYSEARESPLSIEFMESRTQGFAAAQLLRS